MRNPNRIDKLLRKLSCLWYKYPDMRFSQIIQMLFGKKTQVDSSIFYMEDDYMMKKIDDMLKGDVQNGDDEKTVRGAH